MLAADQYIACLDYDSRCKDKTMKARIFKLDKDVVDEIFYVMKNPQLREIYDKQEIFIRKKTLKHKPTEGARYLSAF